MFLLLAAWACIFNAIIIVPTIGRQPRLIDGSQISIEDAPYQISIYSSNSKEPHCGGSIISSEYVLTAGHCIHAGPANYTIRSGSSFWAYGGRTNDVVKIIRHPGFVRDTLTNDIALMRVSPPFDFNNTTRNAVELFERYVRVPAGKSGLISGWGYFKRDSYTLAGSLMGLNVTVIDTNTCRQTFAREGFHDLNDEQFCASIPGVTKDFCNGDSGGPLVIDGRQAGIISWSAGECASPNHPGVYTSVSVFRDWIDKNMKE